MKYRFLINTRKKCDLDQIQARKLLSSSTWGNIFFHLMFLKVNLNQNRGFSCRTILRLITVVTNLSIS